MIQQWVSQPRHSSTNVHAEIKSSKCMVFNEKMTLSTKTKFIETKMNFKIKCILNAIVVYLKP